MCIRDSVDGAILVNVTAQDGGTGEDLGGPDAATVGAGIQLSLIHISEPTRPY